MWGKLGTRVGHGWVRGSKVMLPIAVLLASAVYPFASQGAAKLSTSPPPSLRVGTQTLSRCGLSPLSYCGTLAVPLDHIVSNGPDISIAYRWYPATAPSGGKAPGTVVPVEGGPGYPRSALSKVDTA